MTPDQEKKASKASAKKETPVKPMPQESKAAQKEPKSFVVSVQGVNEIAQCVNDVVASKYQKQALFAALNEHLKPVFD